MKSFILIAAALMTGASIYGIADYRKTSSSKEFNELYKTEKATLLPKEVRKPSVTENSKPARAEAVITKEPVEKIKKDVKTEKKKPVKAKSRSVKTKMFSRASLD